MVLVMKQKIKKTIGANSQVCKSDLLDVHEVRIAYNLACNGCIYYDYCKSHGLSRESIVKELTRH